MNNTGKVRTRMASEEHSQVMDSSDPPASSPAPRENLIATAINFLQNPKVRESSFPQRRGFLEKKGLTKEEIDIAIQRSGTADDELKQFTPPPSGALGVAQGQLLAPPPAPVSLWAKIRDYLATAIVAGGVFYAVYMFYKKYLRPIWFGPSEEEKQLTAIKTSVDDLQKNIAETLSTLNELQEVVTKQQNNIEDVVKTNAAQRGSSEMSKIQESQQTNEIKEEIKSLKGLLLSRKQFPIAPKAAPVLPSWQLESQKSEQANNAQPEVEKTSVEAANTSAESSEATGQQSDGENTELQASELTNAGQASAEKSKEDASLCSPTEESKSEEMSSSTNAVQEPESKET